MSFDFFDAGAMIATETTTHLLVGVTEADLLVIPPEPRSAMPSASDTSLATLLTDSPAMQPTIFLDLEPFVGPEFTGGENDEIVVTGVRPVQYPGLRDVTEPWTGGGGGGGGTPTGDGGGGNGGSEPVITDDLKHERDCSSVAGAADQIRDAVEKTKVTNEGLNTSAERSEYGALIVRGTDGRFGAANDTIYTDQSFDHVGLPVLSGGASNVVGMIHNHPALASDGYHEHLINSYPSSEDWTELGGLVAAGADPTQLSAWVIDYYGQLREFKYTDRVKYEAMNDADKINPSNQPEPSTVEGC